MGDLQMQNTVELPLDDAAILKRSLVGTGLTASSARLIMTISSLENAKALQLSQLLGLDKSTVSRLINKLIEAGYCERWQLANAKRPFYIRITEQGMNLLEKIKSSRTRFARELAEEILPHYVKAHTSLALVDFKKNIDELPEQRSASDKPNVVKGYVWGLATSVIGLLLRQKSFDASPSALTELGILHDYGIFLARVDGVSCEIFSVFENNLLIGSLAVDLGDTRYNEAVLRWIVIDRERNFMQTADILLDAVLRLVDQWKFSRISVRIETSDERMHDFLLGRGFSLIPHNIFQSKVGRSGWYILEVRNGSFRSI